MPSITIIFEHPQADVPKYKFGDRIAVKENCHPKHWLTGEVVGMTLEQEVFKLCWCYVVRLDFSPSYTEEYQELELVSEIEANKQASLADDKNIVSQRNNKKLTPKFQLGMRVRLNAKSGFQNLIKDCAEVVSSKYITSKYWSGWTYELTNENLTSPIEIGEIWLELAPTTAEALTDKYPVSK